MNAEAFRHFYDYHFSENRKMWDSYVTKLSPEQFTQDVDYSHGSVRDQILHLINVDDAWFSDLRGVALSAPLDPAGLTDLENIRAHWDQVEQQMRAYLGTLRDEQLSTRPLSGEDRDLLLWQVLLHVVNHGTDHRAQILRLLNDLGIETTSQDYIFFVYEQG
jgi:uncharacterized damage-inducible protein DinB